jgi:hypothetical protein
VPWRGGASLIFGVRDLFVAVALGLSTGAFAVLGDSLALVARALHESL